MAAFADTQESNAQHFDRSYNYPLRKVDRPNVKLRSDEAIRASTPVSSALNTETLRNGDQGVERPPSEDHKVVPVLDVLELP